MSSIGSSSSYPSNSLRDDVFFVKIQVADFSMVKYAFTRPLVPKKSFEGSLILS